MSVYLYQVSARKTSMWNNCLATNLLNFELDQFRSCSDPPLDLFLDQHNSGDYSLEQNRQDIDRPHWHTLDRSFGLGLAPHNCGRCSNKHPSTLPLLHCTPLQHNYHSFGQAFGHHFPDKSSNRQVRCLWYADQPVEMQIMSGFRTLNLRKKPRCISR